MRQLLQYETENSYQKLTTKCVRGLLHSASGIRKCDRKFITKCVRYYKLLQTVIIKCVRVTKCDRLLLQSASGITKCDSYYKVRRNNLRGVKKVNNVTRTVTIIMHVRYSSRILTYILQRWYSIKSL